MPAKSGQPANGQKEKDIPPTLKLRTDKSAGKQAEVKKLEAEIDQLVYKLYGLTKEKIKIIEGAN